MESLIRSKTRLHVEMEAFNNKQILTDLPVGIYQ